MNCNNIPTNINNNKSTKGNDGRGARKQLVRKVSCVIGIFVCFIGTLHFIDFRNNYMSPKQKKRIRNTVRGTAGEVAKRLKNMYKQGRGGGNDEKETIHLSFKNDEDKPIIQQILDAKLNLVDIELADKGLLTAASSDSYSGVLGTFCQVDFSLHKQNPSEVPMFRDVVAHSESCDTKYEIDLKHIAKASRHYDEKYGQEGDYAPKVLSLGGVAFHESRCGSTLFANSMIAMNPTKHRVYSESSPPLYAMGRVCGENFNACNVYQAAKILQDVVYLMSRSNDSREEYVFFKIQSVGSRFIHVFRQAFPNVPWIFIYREPVQVMMSHLKYGDSKALCLRYQSRPPPIIKAITKDRFPEKSPHDLSNTEFCAAHLASITESALEQIDDSEFKGMAVNYVDLPKILYETVIPHHFHIPIDQDGIDNIVEVSSVYSKARNTKEQEWKSDSEKKEEMASDEVREAADIILKPSYDELENLAEQSMKRIQYVYKMS